MTPHTTPPSPMRNIDRRLIEACQNGDALTVEQLLKKGANPNAQDDYGRTPIIIAIEYGYFKIITTLIQYGADPHATNPDHDSRTALHYAVEYQYHDIAQYLITQLKLNPNSQDQCGNTPLMTASAKGDIKMIRLLVQLGANPHTTNHNGQNALHSAVGWKQFETAQYLITELNLDPNSQDRWGVTPFMIATENGDIKMLELLIQHGANPHTTDHRGRNALHYAIEKRYYDIAKYLITQLKLNPNTHDNNGYNPFLIATLNGDIHMLKFLIQHGADPYATDKDGRNALHYAVEKKYHDIAKYFLIHLQFDLKTQDHEGITPFLLAAQNGDIQMLQLLIQLGADPYITDKRGRTALHYAVENYRYDVFEYLITYLHIDPKAQDHDGNTPLHIALQNNKINTAQILTQLGANPCIPNHQGQTPSSIARQHKIRLLKPQPSTITL